MTKVQNSIEETRQHTRIEYDLAKLASVFKFKFHIARNDKGELCDGKSFRELCGYSEDLSHTTNNKQTIKTIELIDEIWLSNDIPKYGYEIENTTNIRDGIGRLTDLLKSNPDTTIIPVIVYPDERKSEILKELQRPRHYDILDNIKLLSYSKLKDEIEHADKYLKMINPKLFMEDLLDSYEIFSNLEAKYLEPIKSRESSIIPPTEPPKLSKSDKNEDYSMNSVDIYEIVRNIINDEQYAPKIEKENIKISREGWMSFPPNKDNIKISKNAHFSVSFRKIHKDAEKDVGFLDNNEKYMGVIFNSPSAVRNFVNINTTNNIDIINILKSLGDEWTIDVHRKIKEHYDIQTPKYIKTMSIKVNSIDDNLINDIRTEIEKISSEGKSERERRSKVNIKGDYTEKPRIEIARNISLNRNTLNETIPILYKICKIFNS